jgi:predicted transcriptional regulator
LWLEAVRVQKEPAVLVHEGNNFDLSKVDILHAILDEKTWNIFNIIASSDSKSEILITRLKLTRKQYYSRMARLVQTGLAKRQKSRYLLTAFGKVIQDAEMNFEIRIEDALKNYWKLKAIDTLQMKLLVGLQEWIMNLYVWRLQDPDDQYLLLPTQSCFFLVLLYSKKE